MTCKPTINTDGLATFRLRDQLNQQIEKAENHLISIASIHGKDSIQYKKASDALEASKLLYAGLCGDEEPICGVGLNV